MTSLFAPRGSHDEIENGATFMPKFDADGLIPVIAQDSANNEILMFAWMNEEALARTIETGEAWYWSSRSRSVEMAAPATSAIAPASSAQYP